MWRLTILLWVMLGTVFAGILTTVVLLVPSMAGNAMKLIPYAAAVGAVIGIPVSMVASKMISARTNGA